MEVEQFEGESLQYLAIEPDSYDPDADYPMVVLLHGFGANMQDLAGLSPTISREGYIYACPNAPIEFQLGPGMAGYGWTTPRSARTEEEAMQAAGKLDIFFDEVMEQYRIKPGRVMLMGFSQGGGMTYRCGLPRPETFAGLAALSCGLPDAEALKARLPAQRTQPIFIAHGSLDEVAPLQRAQEARAFLEAEGYTPLYKEYPMAHEISQELLADLVPWTNKVLPPLVRVQ